MSLVVLVNGIDDFGESKAAQKTARTQLFSEQFPQVEVKTFDSFYEQDGFLHDGYLRDRANAIIKSLQRSSNEGEPERIIFVAHNTGAALVKQILLIASEDHRHLWIAFKTIALYFVESPSFTNQREWEQFVLRLLSTNRIPFSNLSTLISVLPRALARIEVEFSAISNAFDIKLYGGEIKSMLDSDKEDELRLSTVFLDVRASLRKNSTQIYTPEQKTNYQEFHSLLSRPDASINRLNAVTVLPKFMTWLETYPSYKSWLDDPESTVLRITGPNGSGNTYLSSHILHTLVAEHRGSETLFLSYGFYRWDTRRNSERSLMIRQLLTLRPGLYRRVDNIARLLSKKSSITCQRLWALFRYLLTIPRHSRVFLILNATDQCLQPIARKVGLLTTISSLTIPLKILMTSSTTLEMPENVSSESIDLRDAGWGNVIRSLAEERVLQIVNERPVWKDSQQTIVEKLCSGEYTYLYVMLNLDVLAHSKIPSTKDALNQQLMAPNLCIEQVFDTMVSGLDDVEAAKQALNWIFHAIRPLTVSELAVALTLKPDPSDSKVEKQLTFEILIEKVSWDLMRDLGGLLETTVKIVNDRVYFAHHTFHDYLEKHSNLLISDFHALITEWCISYLSMCSEHTPKMSMEYDSLEQPQIGTAAAFLEYAELYWTEHYKLAQQTSSTHEIAKVRTYAEKKELPPEEMEEPSQERKELPPDEKEELSLDEKVILFLTSDTAAVKKWVEKCTHAFGCYEDLEGDPLFLASQLGLASIVHHVLQDETAINQERVGKAAIIAARAGNIDILEYLLEVAEASALVPALRAAAECGQSNAIKLLLSKMHDSGVVSSEADQGVDSPLLLAALNGHTAAFEDLLSEGYSMQALDASKNTALHLASQLGDVDTLLVMQTLQKDIFVSLMKSINASDESPLQLTCISGSIDAFDLVRSSSPDDQLGEANGDSMHPIQLAAKAGHVTIVERLITAGVDITVGSSWEYPIRLAARNGHYDVVYCLVEKLEKLLVVDVENLESTDSTPEDLKHSLENSLSESLSNPLDDAINNGWSKVAKFLLSKTVRDLDGDRRYIWSAVNGGYLDIVEILVAAGIPAKLPTDRYNGILDIAIRENFVDIVSYLVNQGVTPQWDGEENSIHYAAELGFNLCLHELLRTANDEDVRRKDKNYDSTPLDAAAINGELETFKELLAWEIEHALPDQPWRPLPKTLICAITGEVRMTKNWTKVDLVKFLLSKGWTADVENGGQDIPLHSAVKAGHLGIVQFLLKEGARVEAIDDSKRSVLHVAVQNGEVHIAAFLLENGADPNPRDSDDLTPLHVAAKIEYNQLVRVLLGIDREPNGSAKTCSRADVELKAPDGSRALHFACKSSTITSTLLELDPKPQLDAVLNDSKATPLILAAIGGFGEVVRLLLNAGANADSKDSEDRTALYHLASRFNNHIHTARYLKEHSASPNAAMIDHSTPLYAAVRSANDEMALYLLDEAKADPNLYGGTLHSPLQAATFRGEIDITTRLLKAGANPNAQGGLFGSALHAAMNVGNLEVIELLINEYQAIANLNIPPFGTPLHVLASIGQSSTRPFREIATLLLKHDAEMVNRKYNGHTPLVLAMREEEDCLVLLDLAANPNVSDDTGATALHYAAGFHSLALVEKLLEKMAKADARDGCNRSVLYFAALSADEDKFKAVLDKLPKEERKDHLAEVVPAVLKVRAVAIFEIIIKEEGLDLNVPDRSGWTGLDFANCYEMLQEAKALEEKGAMKGSTKQEPTGWCFEDREGSVLLSEDRMEAYMEGLPGGSDEEDPPFPMLGSVRANHPIPMGKGIFYFEVEILDCGKNSAIAIGLAQECTALDSLIGWGPGTWAYHSDDGSLLTEDDRLGSGDPYGANQIVGVAVDRTQNTAWFTLDGKKVGKVLENVVGQLYPAVSFQQGYSKVKVNFGLKENSAQLKFEPEGGLRARAIEIVTRVLSRRSQTRNDSLDREVIYYRRSNNDRPDEDIIESRSAVSYDRYDRRSMASYDRRDRDREDIYDRRDDRRSENIYERRDRDREDIYDRRDRNREEIRDRRDRDSDYDRRREYYYDRRDDDRRSQVIYERPRENVYERD